MTMLMVREYPGIFDEIETLVDSFGTEEIVTELVPRVNMVEDKDELVVRLELPGIKREDIDVTVDGRTLLIKGEKKVPEFSKDAKYYTCEHYFGTFSRSLGLPFDVKSDKVVTRFEDGVLEIRLPRTEESKPRHIPVEGVRRQLKEPAKSK